MPSPSPTTTSAVKLNRRPPLTTLATRLMATTRSRYAVAAAPAPAPRPSPRRARRSPPAPVPRRRAPGIRSSLSLRSSECQPAFAGRIGKRCDPSVVAVAAAVEDHGVDARGLGALGDGSADGRRTCFLVAVDAADVSVEARRGRERPVGRVVDDLRRDVPGRAGHDEARPGSRALHLLAHAQVPPGPRRATQGRGLGSAHGYLPAFPALRRTTSPW